KPVAVGLLLTALAVCSCREDPHPAADRPVESRHAAPTRQTALVGTASCSARGCHGALEPLAESPSSRSSFSRWLDRDPHAGAYRALSSPLALQMGKRLDIADVSRDACCLACHGNPLAAGEDGEALQEREFGIGCEACHGPARDWLTVPR